MAVEKLGGRQSVCSTHGPQPGDHLRGGEEAQEEAADRLHVFQSQAPQLLGISILFL